MIARRKVRKVKEAIFVFCEGETEQRYIDLLRTNFRIPIQIVTKVLNTKISQRLIETHINSSGYPNVDKVFLFYDGDRPDIIERLYSINHVQVMLSCPCVEFWFLLHYTDYRAYISSESAVRLMLKHCPEYKKGELRSGLKDTLLQSWRLAASRAKSLHNKSNPSTTAYLLPEYLDSINKSNCYEKSENG